MATGKRSAGPRKLGVPTSIEFAHVLFLDVVGFSKRLMDEQLRLIDRLEGIVRETSAFQQALEAENLIRLPTGDGMALVFLRDPAAAATFAREVSIALKNTDIPVRMGINSGPVHPRADIRGDANVAGAGINHAQRAMDCGGKGHILLTGNTAEALVELSQEWKNSIHPLGEFFGKARPPASPLQPTRGRIRQFHSPAARGRSQALPGPPA